MPGGPEKRRMDPLVLVRGLPGHPLHPVVALIGGLIVSVPIALSGLIDWLAIGRGSPRWRTATLHLTAMVSAVALFALAAWRRYHGYQHGHVTTGGLVLTLCGASVLTLGG